MNLCISIKLKYFIFEYLGDTENVPSSQMQQLQTCNYGIG